MRGTPKGRDIYQQLTLTLRSEIGKTADLVGFFANPYAWN